MLGAGGAGKAVVYGLTRRGVQGGVSDGVARQALTLAQQFECHSVEWAARHTVAPTCWSTARRWACTRTSTKRRLRSTICGPSMIVFDVVYNPENTMLVKDARKPQLHGGDRRRHVRPPGLRPVPVVHRPGRPRRPDAGDDSAGDWGGEVLKKKGGKQE